jgi:signal transduction histidine kinase
MQFDIPPDDPFHDVFSAVTAMHNDIYEIIGRLEKARGDAVEANRRKDRLVADVSHELRSPLTAIMLLSDMLCAVKDPVEMVHYAGEVRAVARRMNRIIDDILEMSRMDAGRSAAAHVSFALREELSLLCEQFSAEAARKELRFDVTWNGPVLRPIVGDPLKVTQVLANLIGNAVKYTDAGFIAVRVDLREEGDRGRVAIEVADSGVGIAPEAQRHLFERFSRGGSDDTGRRPGAGLGLAIARELARLMGGDIILSSEPGRGSVFSFTFPVEFRDTSFTDETSAGLQEASAVYGEGGSS